MLNSPILPLRFLFFWFASLFLSVPFRTNVIIVYWREVKRNICVKFIHSFSYTRTHIVIEKRLFKRVHRLRNANLGGFLKLGLILLLRIFDVNISYSKMYFIFN